MRRSRLLLVPPFALLLLASAWTARQDWDAVPIETRPVAGAVHVLYGRGGNLGIQVGDDGVLLVDDQFAPLAPRIRAAIAELSDRPIELLVNTHWHGDHTGGNVVFGGEAFVMSHENVRRRLAGDAAIGGRVNDPPTPAKGLPRLTFEEGVTLFWNGEEVRVWHVGPAHTDGDSVLWFTGSGVAHLGDLFFNGTYPFVDLASGGDVEGLERAIAGLLERLPERTRLIPGHGEVGELEDLRAYHEMLRTSIGRVREALAAGKDREAMVEEGLLADLDATWGGSAFVPPERWLATVVESLSR